jgi:biotin transport system substrate-specific component
MTQLIEYIENSNEKIKFLRLILFGCALITLGALIKTPLIPVSFTLQTFAIYILSLTQIPKIAFASTLSYLACASMGLPVFSGHANPFWMLGKCGGYLIAFPIAAYLIARLRQTHTPMTALLYGMALIFTLGFLWLIPFLGIQTAFIKGVLIFIPSELIKALSALHIAKRRNPWL